MTDEPKHSPLPWQVEPHSEWDKDIFIDGRMCRIDNDDVPEGEGEANAQFIVTACNSHYTLIEENKRLRQALHEIACWDDEPAQRTLDRTGSYSSFDEPGAVQTSRAALTPQPTNGEGE